MLRIKGFFTKQQIDEAGRLAVKIQLVMFILFFLDVLSIVFDFIGHASFQTVVAFCSIALLGVGFVGAKIRNRPLLLIYFVINAVCVVLTIVGIILALIAVSIAFFVADIDGHGSNSSRRRPRDDDDHKSDPYSKYRHSALDRTMDIFIVIFSLIGFFLELLPMYWSYKMQKLLYLASRPDVEQQQPLASGAQPPTFYPPGMPAGQPFFYAVPSPTSPGQYVLVPSTTGQQVPPASAVVPPTTTVAPAQVFEAPKSMGYTPPETASVVSQPLPSTGAAVTYAPVAAMDAILPLKNQRSPSE